MKNLDNEYYKMNAKLSYLTKWSNFKEQRLAAIDNYLTVKKRIFQVKSLIIIMKIFQYVMRVNVKLKHGIRQYKMYISKAYTA